MVLFTPRAIPEREHRVSGSTFTSCAAVFVAIVSGCSVQDPGAVRRALARYNSSLAIADDDTAVPGTEPARTDAVDDNLPWLAAGAMLARELAEERARPSDTQPARADHKLPYVRWRKRYGPAYPDDKLKSFGRDLKEFPDSLLDDAVATVTNPVSLVSFALAGGAAFALKGANANDPVERHFWKHGGQLNDFWDTVGDVGGHPGVHVAVAAAGYTYGLCAEDNRTYEASKTMLNALALNGMVTLTLKAVAQTESPNGDDVGWPSGHTSSSFCFATVAWHEYGPWVGAPLMAFAAYVGYERIDARNHDFNDVISGALIGFAIGHAVASNHKARIAGLDVVPYVGSRGDALGVALAKQW